MLKLPITGKHSVGRVCLIDDEDYQRVIDYGSWVAVPGRRTVYARAYVRGSGRANRRYMYLHSLLTGWKLVDHVNRNGLDNRKSNLRQVTHSENQQNRGLNRNNTSGYRGVNQCQGRWAASISKEGERRYLGWFGTPEEAARAYNEAALGLYGANAALNDLGH